MADKHLLTDMQILEISLVDEPANPQAHVEIFKRKETDMPNYSAENPVPMPILAGAVVAALNDLSAQIVEKALAAGFAADPSAAARAASLLQETVMDGDAVTKALADAEAKVEELAKALADKDGEIAKSAGRVTELEIVLKAKDEEIAKAKKKKKSEVDANENGEPDADEEEVMKSLPEAIRKRLEEAEASKVELQKMREKEELSTAIAKAKGMGVAEPEKVGALLLRIAKGKTTTEDAQLLEGILKGAAAIGATAAIFKSIGTAAVAEINEDPEAFLKAKAEEISKAKGIPYAAAYTEAMDQNPQAYNAYLAKRRVAN
jgi:hypothetical protein